MTTTMPPKAVDVAAFVRMLQLDAMPADVVAQAQRCVLDLIGVAAGGARTPAASIVNAYAASHMTSRASEARLLFDGRRASRAGAAFAGATTIDALDAHDGHVLTKGHAGVAVLPALLAAIDGGAACDGAEFLTCVVLGYEIGTRAGIALHTSVPDYHCSGAWNALACAAIVARLLRLDAMRLREALGIAEYAGPRGQILRVCAHPTMLKDGSSWGAHAGVTAALLASDGFTGAPALTIEDDEVRALWSDLGQRWRIREQYFKAYPVCRWAQPAIEAALALKREHGFDVADVDRVGIESFREAIDLGSQCPSPATTDEAQYSLPYGVAAALAFERVGAEEVNTGRVARPARGASARPDRTDRGCGILAPLSGGTLGAPAHHAGRRPHAGVGAGARARKSRKPADRRRATRQIFCARGSRSRHRACDPDRGRRGGARERRLYGCAARRPARSHRVRSCGLLTDIVTPTQSRRIRARGGRVCGGDHGCFSR